MDIQISSSVTASVDQLQPRLVSARQDNWLKRLGLRTQTEGTLHWAPDIQIYRPNACEMVREAIPADAFGRSVGFGFY